MKNILDLISDLGKKEEELLYSGEIMSPVHGNETIVARVEGLVYSFQIPRVKPGWYVFKAKDSKQAKYVRHAELSDRDLYFKNLPQIRMNLCFRKEGVYYANPVKGSKLNLQSNLLYPIYLTDDLVMDFDRILCRFDGENFWHEDLDMGSDPEKPQYLRECLKNLTPSDKIRFKGLTVDEKACYAIRVAMDKKFLENNKELQLRKDIEHGGGRFISFQEKSDHFKIEYEVDGEKYTSHVAKTSGHKVLTAGICLNGGDADFDLKSLISVMREGQDRNLIHRTMRR